MAGRYDTVDYTRHDGGMNLVSGAPNIREYEFADSQNVTLDVNGSVGPRAGHALVGTVVPAKRELLSWWRAEEAAGTRYDIAQGRNHLSDSGGVGNEAGFEGTKALRFTGAEFLNILNGSQYQMDRAAADFSFSFWYKVAAHAATRILLTRADGASTAGYEVADVGGLIRFRVYRPGPTTIEALAITAIDNGAWHHVAVTHSAVNDRCRVYIDGALDVNAVNAAGDYAAFAATFYLGATQAGAASFIGALDDISFWSTELDAAAVTALRNAGVAGGTATFSNNGKGLDFKGLWEYKPTNLPREVIGVCAGLVVRYESTTGRFQPIPFPSNFATYLSDTARHTGAQLNNRFYFGNGVETNWRYEGALVLQSQGLTDGGTKVVATLSQQAGGNVEDDNSYYQYRLVPIRQVGGGRIIVGRPTTVASATVQMVGAAGKTIRIADWTGAAAVDLPGQTHWGLFRIKKPAAADPDPLTAYWWIADLVVTTTTYDDTKAQAAAIAGGDHLGLYFENRKTPPVKWRAALTVKAGDTMLQAGDPNLPHLLYPTSPTQGADVHLANTEEPIGRDDGDPINGLAAYYDYAVILKEDSIVMYEPTLDGSEFPFRLHSAFANVGCSSGHSIVNRQNVLTWKADEAIFEMYGVQGFGGVRVREISRRIAPRLKAIAGSRTADVIGVYLRRPQLHHVRYAWTPVGAAKNTDIYPYDANHLTPDPQTGEKIGAWTSKWTGITAEVMAPVEDTTSGLDDIWIGDDQGRVFKADTGKADATGASGALVPIQGFAWSAHYDHHRGKTTKRHRELVLDGFTIAGPLNVEWVVDYGQRPGGSHSVNLGLVQSVAAAEWGISDWGIGVWGGGVAGEAQKEGRFRMSNATGHHLQLRFSFSTLNMDWLLHSWQVGAVPIGSHRSVRV